MRQAPHPARLTLLSILALSLFPSARVAAAPAVFTAEAAEKVRPTATARPLTPARLRAAKNEFEAFQVVVVGPATGVSLSASPLTGPGQPLTGIHLYREALITCPHPSSRDGAAGPWPDPLIPDRDEFDGEKRNAFPFDVPSGQNRVVFVDVLVPRDQAPGDYSGRVTVSSQQGTVEVPVELTVWPFELPSTASLRNYYSLQYGALPSAHGVSGDAFSRLRVRYGVLGLDHRISIGWFDDGNPSTSHFDAWYAPLVAGSAPTRLPGAALTSVKHANAPATDWAYFTSKGWEDRLFDYTCDEPPMACAWSAIAPRAAAVHAVSPRFRTLVTTSLERATANGVLSSINLLVPEVQHLFPNGGPSLAPTYAAFLQGPYNELWMYQSCDVHGCGGNDSAAAVGWPSFMVDASGTRNRAMQWFSFQAGATGELYYETTLAYTDPGDPWNSVWAFTGCGDGTLFYPGTPAKIGGTTHVPVASYRLKMIREGMEDFEYLQLATRLGGSALAQQVAKTLFPSATRTDVPVSSFLDARTRLAEYIVQASHPEPCADGTAAGACSATRPWRCEAGKLVEACGTCGCAPDQTCRSDGSCRPRPAFEATRIPTPAIDGDLSEYARLPSLAIGGSQVRVGWNAQALLLAFAVADEGSAPPPPGEESTWNGDGVEVMLAVGSDRSTVADEDDLHLVVGVNGTLSDARSWTDFGFSAGATAQVARPGADGHYTVEVQLPWAALGIAPVPGLQLGFDLAVNDRDGDGQTASTDWAGLDHFNAPPAWGTLTLLAEPDADAGAGPDASAPDANEGTDAETLESDAHPVGLDAALIQTPDASGRRTDAGLALDPALGACGCSSLPGASGSGWWAAWLLLAARRRRLAHRG